MAQTEEEKIREAAIALKDRRFEIVPSILFQNDYRAHEGEHDRVLELVAGGVRVCPMCDEEVEEGDAEGSWECDSCEINDETEDITYDELPMKGSQLAWPCAHSYLFWSSDADWNGFVEAADQAGFLVFEHPEINGYFLGIDGGGYDFVDAHWVKLYNNLGLRWHEHS